MPARLLTAVAVLSLLVWGSSLAADARERNSAAGAQNDNSKTEDIDSEHIFGFTEGSDVGDAGEREAEIEPVGRFGKRTGFYAATSTALELKYTVMENFRVAPLVLLASHNIGNVPGLEDRNQWTIEGIGAELRYRLMDRERAPFGLALSALPHRNRVDAMTGAPIELYGIDFVALFDKELVPKRLFAALNLLYEPSWARSRETGAEERDATVGIGAALSAQIAQGLFAGAEARYFRRYEGIGLDRFLGEALFVGPSAYFKLSKEWFASVAWNAQVAGRAVGAPGPLDLTNFDRHEIRLRAGFQF